MKIEKLTNLENCLLEYAIKFEDLWKSKMIENNIYASDKLYNSFNIDINLDNTTYTVDINLEDYWIFVENGRKAGGKFPPLNAILDWIKIKPIIPKSVNGVKPNNKQLAFLIGRSIAEKGIKAKPIMAETTEELQEAFLSDIVDAIKKDIYNYINLTFKEYYE